VSRASYAAFAAAVVTAAGVLPHALGAARERAVDQGGCAVAARFDPERLPSTPSKQWAADDTIDAVLPCGNRVYVGGGFNVLGPYTGGFAAVSPRTGAPEAGMTVLGKDVSAITADGSGGWIVGTRGDLARTCASLLRVRRDGSVAWQIPACPRDAQINTAARSGSTVYVGGKFAILGGKRRLNAAAADVRTGRPLPWNPRVGGTPVYDRETLVPREVNAIDIAARRVYIGGFFDRVGGRRHSNLAAVDPVSAVPVGGNLVDFGGIPFETVDAVKIADGVIYLGGDFSIVHGKRRRGAAAVDAATGRVLPWDARLRGSMVRVRSVALARDTVYLGGTFSSSWSRGRSNLAAVSTRTGIPLAWAPHIAGGGANGAVNTVLSTGRNLVVAGDFITVNDQPHPYAALVAPDGGALRWPVGPAGPVDALAYDGQRIAVGGAFRGIGAVYRPRLAAVDARSGRVLAWTPQPDGYVNALETDGKRLYVGGAFTHIGTVPRRRLAAFSRPSLRLAPWRADVAGQSVDALKLTGSTLFVGGVIERILGEPRQALAAIDPAGPRVLPFRAAITKTSGITRPEIDALDDHDGTLLLHGFLSTGPTAAVSDFAALDDQTGSLAWTLQATSPSGEPTIGAFALSGKRLFLIGNFTSLGGKARRGAAAVDASTGKLLPWKLNTEPDNDPFSVSAAAAATDEWVILGGDYTRINGERRAGIAAVSAAGSTVAAWHPTRHEGGFEATFVTAGADLYVYDYDDAALAAFTGKK
jgi:trimeric autotransporter adhesin